MIRRLFNRLPGPPVVRWVQAAVLLLLALVLLGYLFEQLGGLLDTGGVIQ